MNITEFYCVGYPYKIKTKMDISVIYDTVILKCIIYLKMEEGTNRKKKINTSITI